MTNNRDPKPVGRYIFFTLCFVLLSLCAASPPTPQATDAPTKNKCPADMIWVASGEFCMDRYEFPNRKGAVPLRGLPYSEARTICRKKGKKIPTVRDFMQACMGPNNNTHPYGNEFVPGKCRTGLTWPEGPAPAGSYPECVSDPGVYDMSGNLWEWLHTKRGNPPIAGGAWNSVAGKTGCNVRMGLFGKVHSPNIGFRCVLYPNKKKNKKRGNKKPGGR